MSGYGYDDATQEAYLELESISARIRKRLKIFLLYGIPSTRSSV
jgi:hypothetical protein